FAPYRLSGRVCGVLLNDASELQALGPALSQPPYKAPPQAPVLEIKPHNTWAADGDDIVVPADVAALRAGAQIAAIIGRTACRVDERDAAACVAGYLLAADIEVPHESHYRPALRFKARDGFCPIGATALPAEALPDPEALVIQWRVDGELVRSAGGGGRVRGLARLIADVTDYMTLQPGDLLLLGAAAGAPLLRPGQALEISAPGLGRLRHRFVAGEGRA
ncbi:MAG: fumarylacetoacetate hydrolase family protein, partial [Burkholderiales bacterium]|nr:fumarylacetoacetate hydrolase family protein [Burkholderiales bacterium]